jgi:hypothetical protein
VVIALSHLARGEIPEQTRPCLLGIADDDGIGVRSGILRCQGDVRTAQYHGDAPRTEIRGKLVGAHRRPGNHRHTDQIDLEIRRNHLYAFVEDRQLMLDLVRYQRGERRQGQRRVSQRLLEDSTAVAIERAFRRYQG